MTINLIRFDLKNERVQGALFDHHPELQPVASVYGNPPFALDSLVLIRLSSWSKNLIRVPSCSQTAGPIPKKHTTFAQTHARSVPRSCSRLTKPPILVSIEHMPPSPQLRIAYISRHRATEPHSRFSSSNWFGQNSILCV